jgi:hypothetical protein
METAQVAGETKPPMSRMMVILSADELAAALHKACGMDEKKMGIPAFALVTAEKVIKLLPPLYYEPRNER